jgi:heme exporter protein A
VIALAGATRRFGEVVALEDVSLSITSGESVGLMGPNGAGKSTLLRAVAGLTRLTEGDITVRGNPARHANRQRVGLLAHESFLYGPLTARENLMLAADLHGVDSGAIDDVLERVGMTWAANSAVDTFSRGMEQRVSLARVLLCGADIVLLDEPFSGLDAAASTFLIQELDQLRAKGATLLLVTHDPLRAARVIDRVVVLVRGCVVADEPVTDAATFPARYQEIVGGA